jgi:hypothetical protein
MRIRQNNFGLKTLMHYPCIFLERLRKTKKNLILLSLLMNVISFDKFVPLLN